MDEGATGRLQSRNTSYIYDLGEIKSLVISYDVTISASPIPIFGYKNTFCMDLGVTKKYEIDFTRINPPVNKQSTTSSDPLKWSNKTWSERIIQELEVWQAKGDGFLFSFTPNNVELFPTLENNVYISNISLNLKGGDTRKINGTMYLSVGSLDMDMQGKPDSKAITFIAENGDVVTSNSFKVAVQYGEYYTIPNAPEGWMKQIENAGKSDYLLYWVDDNGNRYDKGQRVKISENTPDYFYGRWQNYESTEFYTDSSTTGAEPYLNVRTLSILLIGCGGKGGAGTADYSGGGGAGGGCVLLDLSYGSDEGDAVYVTYHQSTTDNSSVTVSPIPKVMQSTLGSTSYTWYAYKGEDGEDATSTSYGQGGISTQQVVAPNGTTTTRRAQTGADGDSGDAGGGYIGGNGTTASKCGGAGGGAYGFPYNDSNWSTIVSLMTKKKIIPKGSDSLVKGVAMTNPNVGGGGCGGTYGVNETTVGSGVYAGTNGAKGIIAIKVAQKYE